MSDSWLGSAYSLGAALSWAVAVNLFKRGAEQVEPAALNFFKSALALLVFSPFVLIAGLQLNSESFWALILSGVIGIGIADTLFFWALRRITASQLAIMDCLFSPMVVVFAAVLLGERVGLIEAWGGAVIIGSIVLARPRFSAVESAGEGNAMGLLAAAVSIGLMGLSVVMVKPIVESYSVVETTAVRLLGASVSIVLLIGFNGLVSRKTRGPAGNSEWQQLLRLLRPQPLWRTVVPAALLGNCVSLYLWIGGYKYLSAHTAALLNQMSTPFIVMVAVLFFGERISRRTGVSLTLACFGCLMVLY